MKSAVNRRRNSALAALFLSALSFVAVSCASVPTYYRDGMLKIDRNRTAFLAPVYLQDLYFTPNNTQEKAFIENQFVGRIKFSGGIVRDETLDGMTRSKNTAFSSIEEYKKTISGMIDASVRQAIIRNTDPRQKSETYTGDFLAMQRVPAPIDPKRERTDNMNRPFWKYSFFVKSGAQRPADIDAAARYLVVPIIECAYSHSAGWFYDQSSGCTAGIRMRVHVLAIDLDKNEICFSFFDDIRLIPGIESDISVNTAYSLFATASDQLTRDLKKAIR